MYIHSHSCLDALGFKIASAVYIQSYGCMHSLPDDENWEEKQNENKVIGERNSTAYGWEPALCRCK